MQKDISKIDKNFDLHYESYANCMTYYPIPHPAFALYGIQFEEAIGFMRVPMAIAETVSDGVAILTKQPAGGRLRFSTNSKKFELKVTYEALYPMRHMPLVGQGGFILLEETEKSRRLVKILPPTFADKEGYSASAELKGDKMYNYILYFPLYNPIGSVTIGLESTAKVEKGKKYRPIKPILYYGSSITQGGCASRPDNCYQAIIEKWNNIDFINMGFSGNGKAEDKMVDYLTSIDCSVFVCDYDYNAPDAEYLKQTHYRLYERYRKVRPDTSILFLSRPDVWGEIEETKREKIIRATYQRAKKAGDNNVYFIAGKSFFGDLLRDNCTVDGCHPNDLGFSKMADKIYKALIQIDKKYQ